MKIVSWCALALLAVAAVALVVEFAIFFERNDGAWWTVAVSVVLAFGAWLVLREQVVEAANFGVRFLLRHAIVNIAVAIATVAAACSVGVLLYRNRDPPDGVYRLFAYSGTNLPENRIEDLVVIFEIQAPAEHKRMAAVRTSAEGLAEFPAHAGDLLTVRVRDASNRYYVLESRSLTAADFASARPFDPGRVPAKEWRPGTADAPQGANISWLDANSPQFRPPSRVRPEIRGSAEAVDALSRRLGLPAAEMLIGRDAFVVGFDRSRRQARWVAYEIKGRGENVRREGRLTADPLISADDQARDSDYRGSGFERGHLVPLADVATSQEIARQTDYSTTLVPMNSRLNRSIYVRLRNYTAQLKRPGARVFVIRGPAFVRADRILAIGANQIPVPTHIFQIAAQLEDGRLRLECFLVPNLKSYDGEPGRGIPPADRYRTPRPAIERATGLSFFAGIEVTETGCR
ncbi:MAG TPA: DNA/RNA non-specific endonuclease [Allosphingosinicella sp.]